MTKQITCTALAMLMFLCVRAQGFGEIHGKLITADSLPVVGFVVVATNGVDVVGDVTDLDGKYRIKPLKAGNYDVAATMMFYDTLQWSAVEVKIDEITNLPVQMVTASTGTVVIPYTRPHLDPTLGTMITLGAKELKNNASFNGGNVNNLIASMSSEIKVSPDGEELYFRGSRAGSVIYFIDGVKYTGGNPRIPSSGVNSVAVYTGGLPAKYGVTTGGVVVIETKNYLQEYYRMLNQ